MALINASLDAQTANAAFDVVAVVADPPVAQRRPDAHREPSRHKEPVDMLARSTLLLPRQLIPLTLAHSRDLSLPVVIRSH
jgi:hypothetical protein